MPARTRSSSIPGTEDEAARRRREQALDVALELTFPASDPIAVSVPTPGPRALDSGEVIVSDSEHFENVILGGGEAGCCWSASCTGSSTDTGGG